MSLRDLERPASSRRKRTLKAIPEFLHPYRDMPYKQAPDGVIRCRFCNSDKKIELRVGLCKWCFDAYCEDAGRRCFGCGEPSSRSLRKGMCQPCIGKALRIPENLEALVKARYVGIIKG